MAGPYRNNVVVTESGAATFSPPLDAVYVTASASTGQGSSLTFTINGTEASMPSGQFTTGKLVEVGGVEQISMSSGNAFRYIGLRVLNKSGSSNATNDVLPTGEGGG